MTHIKYFSYALIPAIIILTSAILGSLVFSSNANVDFDEAFIQQKKEAIQNQAIEHAKALDGFFLRIIDIENTINDFATKIFEDNSPSNRTTYYHDSTLDKVTPNPVSSAKHGQTVDFSVSAYLVATSEGNYNSWSPDIMNTINVSADLDLFFPATYETMDEILWTYIGFENGVHRTYPWHGPFSDTYDPRDRPWYTAAGDTAVGEVAFTTPSIDTTTGSVIVTAIMKLQVNSNKIGVIGIDFKLDTIQEEVLNIDAGKGARAFLVNEDQQVIAHPDHKLPNVSWQATDLQASITEYETDDKAFTDAIEKSFSSNSAQTEVEIDGINQLVSIVSLNNTDLALGIIVPVNEVATTSSSGSITFILTLNILFIIIFILLFFSGKFEAPINDFMKNRKQSSSVQKQKTPIESISRKKNISKSTKSIRGICPSCNNKLSPEMKFCNECGTRVPSSVHEPVKKSEVKQEIQWRLQRFEKIIRRSDSLEIEQLAGLLEFDENELLIWLINLPDNFGFNINKSVIEFDLENIENHIDDLMDSFASLEEKRIGKIE